MPRAKNDDATPKTSRRSANLAEVPRPVSNVQTMPVTQTPANAEEEIRRRAYELYEQDGRQHGRDREHWLRAEAEVLGRRAPGQKSA